MTYQNFEQYFDIMLIKPQFCINLRTYAQILCLFLIWPFLSEIEKINLSKLFTGESLFGQLLGQLHPWIKLFQH